MSHVYELQSLAYFTDIYLCNAHSDPPAHAHGHPREWGWDSIHSHLKDRDRNKGSKDNATFVFLQEARFWTDHNHLLIDANALAKPSSLQTST